VARIDAHGVVERDRGGEPAGRAPAVELLRDLQAHALVEVGARRASHLVVEPELEAPAEVEVAADAEEQGIALDARRRHRVARAELVRVRNDRIPAVLEIARELDARAR